MPGTGRFVVSIPKASSDGKWYSAFPQGNAPTGPGQLAGSPLDEASVTATLTSATGGTDSFFNDPYAGFTSYIADTTFAGSNGTVTTVSWNGGTLTGPTYSTLQSAINAAAGPSNRVCVLAGQSWAPPSGGFSIPSTAACTADTPFVIQGDPAATWVGPLTSPTSTMAQVNGGGGTASPMFSLGAGVNNQYVIFRKLEITNVANASTGVDGIALYNTASYTGCIIEYCWIHNFRASGAGGETSAIYVPTRGDNTPFTVRYCKVGDVQVYGGGRNDNMSAIGLYGGFINAHNNEIYGATNGIRFKANPNQTPNQCYVRRNIIHDCYRYVTFNNGGGNAENGTEISGNLFCWLNFDSAVFPQSTSLCVDGGEGNLTATTPTGIQVFNNTFAPGMGFALTNDACRLVQFYNNAVLCSNPVQTSYDGDGGTLALCDWNAYFKQSNFALGSGSGAVTITTFSSGSAGNRWTTAHTDHPSIPDLTADPDAHGLYIPALASPYNTVAGNFPNAASNDYTLAAGSPLKGAGMGGADIGYDPTNCGPGW